METLATLLRKSSISDLLLFFPSTIRDRKHLEAHFRSSGLSNVADWYLKRLEGQQREEIIGRLREIMENASSATLAAIEEAQEQDDSAAAAKSGEGHAKEQAVEEAVEYVKAIKQETKLGELELVQWVWAAVMGNVDWSGKEDLLESAAMKSVNVSVGKGKTSWQLRGPLSGNVD